jgi:putative protease
MKKIELLAPAGNMEKLRIAYAYGADAVYLGLNKFSLRDKADNFNFEELDNAVEYARSINKRIYVTLNILPKNKDLDGIIHTLEQLSDIKTDAVIIADIGLIELAKKYARNVDIHVSTQANILNRESAKAFCKLGAKRLILARELSLKDVSDIKEAVGSEHEIEIFLNGAMCMSYSGRCLLSAYMTGRDANQGDCAQPCRWKYALVEEKRPGQYFPVYEDDSGSYILNSKDLNMINHIPELLESKADSFKIEGRMKSSFYVATVTKAYRSAFDDYMEDKQKYLLNLDEYNKIVSMASHRQFTTAYSLEDNKNFVEKTNASMIYTDSSYIRDYTYSGFVEDYNRDLNLAKIHELNPVFINDNVILMSPHKGIFEQKVNYLYDEDMNPIDKANHPAMTYYMKTDIPVENDTIIIKRGGQ